MNNLSRFHLLFFLNTKPCRSRSLLQSVQFSKQEPRKFYPHLPIFRVILQSGSLTGSSRRVALMQGSPRPPLQHHYSGIRHQHQPFKSNVLPSPLQLLYACLCRRNTSPFVWQFRRGGPCLVELCAPECLCAILMNCNVL